jgi:3-hydroxyisobutyrate dehydrogenase
METLNTPNHHTRVAVIGAGTMGDAMATRLLDAGMMVDVWSRHKASTIDLVNAGATGFVDVGDAVQEADVILSMLPTGDVTVGVMFDQSGVNSMRPGAIWVQMGTIGVQATERLAALTRAWRPDVTFVDAPVSGSRGPAESGQLLILASGPESAGPPLEPVFETLGRKTLWLGPAGAGSRMKLVLNTWLAFQIEGAAEAASLAHVLDVEPASLVEALDGNPLASPYGLAKLGRMVEGNYAPDFSIDLALKDLDLVASDAGADGTPIASAIADRWRALIRGGAGGLDVSAARLGLEDSQPLPSPDDGDGPHAPESRNVRR